MLEKGYSRQGDVEYLRGYDQDEADVYPHPSVRIVRPGQHTWKYALSKYLLTRRALYIAIALCILTILLIVIVAVSVSRSSHSTVTTTPWAKGLKYYPIPDDGSDVIEYRTGIRKDYEHLVRNVSAFLSPYMDRAQADPAYVDCDSHRKPLGNQSCHFCVEKAIPDFDGIITSNYCFQESNPCIWLQLKVPVGEAPQPIRKGNKLYEKAKSAVGERRSDHHIGVSCEGQTPHDDTLLSRGVNENIEYAPKLGFPVYYFPATSEPHYVAPLVMVKFNTIHTSATIAVRCTAWATSPGGASSKSALYVTQFKLHVY